MRTRNSILAALALTFLAVAPGVAGSMTVGGEVYGAFNTYKMKDLNSHVDSWNSLVELFGIKKSGLKQISNGVTGGLELRLKPDPSWMLSVGWEPIFAETEDSQSAAVTDGTNNFELRTHARINVDANVFALSAAYFLPSRGASQFGFGGGLDIVKIKGKLEESFLFTPEPPPSDSIASFLDRPELGGTGVGFHVNALGEWSVSPGFGVTATAGYRFAKVSDTKFDDLSSDPKSVTDYSGFIGRLGLVFYLPNGGK